MDYHNLIQREYRQTQKGEIWNELLHLEQVLKGGNVTNKFYSNMWDNT